jgi:hypothetical protein
LVELLVVKDARIMKSRTTQRQWRCAFSSPTLPHGQEC